MSQGDCVPYRLQAVGMCGCHAGDELELSVGTTGRTGADEKVGSLAN